jgi:uncharacterized protein (TIGR03086 family)
MDLNEALTLSTTNFLSLLEHVGPNDLALATPCEGWAVRDLVAHVARGSDMSVSLLNGASQSEASELLMAAAPDDVLGECRRALAAQLAAMTNAVDLERIVHHTMGDISTRQLFDFRIGDLTLHAWDLARALSIPDELPDELVEHVYDVLLPMEAFIGDIGVFGRGPSGAVEVDSTTQAKLLDLTGRRP